MKIVFTIVTLLLISGAATAEHLPTPQERGKTLLSHYTAESTVVFEAAGRKGSRRVGGSGRSGKGGKYVGGRK